jgi:IS4 transposase
LDRTNWQYGDKNINYLVLSWRITKDLSVPLMFVELNKAGNSNTKERIDLLEKFDKLFGFHRIRSLMADREFVGEKWFKMLNKNNITYYIRIKENTLLPWGSDTIPAKNLFDHLTEKQTRLVEKTMYGGTVYFAGTRSKAGDLVIVMTNKKLKAEKILSQYRQRWSIEELFRKLKTSGFHWENTHMKKSERLVTLLIILCFALLIAFLLGKKDTIPWRKTPAYPVVT